MRKSLILSFLFSFCFVFSSFGGVHNATVSTSPKEQIKTFKSEWKSLSRKEKRTKRKALRSDVKNTITTQKAQGVSNETILLAIIGVFIPPLAMALYDGFTSRFWISLLLTILLFIPGMIYTLYIIIKGL